MSCCASLILSCMFASLPASAFAAGMNTHTMVGHRVYKYYGKVKGSAVSDLHNSAIQSHGEAVHGGADFPDFLFACGANDYDHHDAAEQAHWPPFQAAAARYIRQRPDFQSGKWSPDTQKLVAFLYGISVHYMSDELWEGLTGELGRGQGFTAQLSSFNLGGDGMGNEQENIANLAGDFFVSWAMAENDIKPWTRYWPVHELADIFHLYNYSGKTFKNVTVTSLVECSVLFDLGLWAEKTFGQFLFHAYSEVEHTVPMVSERVLDAPISGIDDMAVWSSWVWERVARWLDEGPPANPSPRLQARVAPPNKEDEADVWLQDFIRSLEPLRHLVPELSKFSGKDLLHHADSYDPLQGLVYHGPPHLRDAVEQLLSRFLHFKSRGGNTSVTHSAVRHALRLMDADQETQELDVLEAASDLDVARSEAGFKPVAYYGSALASGDFDGDGELDVVTGAYGTGEAGSPQRGAISIAYNNGSSIVLAGPMTHARFGWELATLDFNKDGIDDLAVAAPTASWNDTLPVSDHEPYIRFWGSVYIFYGKKGAGILSEPGTVISTHDELTGLGMSMSAGDVDGDGYDDLMIGAPMSSFKVNPEWSDRESIQRGALFVFTSSETRGTLASQTLDARKDASLKIEGPSGYDWFGASAAVASADGERFLLVGAPGSRAAGNTTGRVYMYTLDAYVKTGLQAALVLTLTGTEPLAEFGHAVAARTGDATSPCMVAMGSPAGSKARGEVRIVPASKLAALAGTSEPDVKISQLNTQAVIFGEEVFGRLGLRLAFADVSGDHIADLVVAAPLANGGFFRRESGRVYVWDGASLPQGTVSQLQHSASWSAAGSHTRGRFGSAFVHASHSKASPGMLAIGSPRADSSGLEMAGIVDYLPVTFGANVFV